MDAPETRTELLQIVYRDLRSLVPYAKNSRKHPPSQIAKLRKLLAEYGWTNPMLIAEGHMIAGHGRLAAALEMAQARQPIPRNPDPWQGPTVDLSHLTPAQRRAYVIADNKSALDAEWDNDILMEELGGLQEDGFDLALTGFGDEELTRLLGGSGPAGGNTDPDEVPSVPKHPVTEPGDIWLLGKHRMMCGDSTNPQHIDRLMQGELAAMCFTSPPYGQQRDYKSGGISDWDALMQGVFGILPVDPLAPVLVNLGLIHRDSEWMPYWDGWIEWMRAAGWRRFGWYVWDQGFGLPGDWNGRLGPSFEFIFHFNRQPSAGQDQPRPRKTKQKNEENIAVRGTKTFRHKDGSLKKFSSPEASLQSNKIPDSVIRVNRHTGGLGKAGDHPAVFPVGLAAEMITAFSDPGAIIFEPFTGSGSQIIAAEQHDRIFRGCELAPEYADVAVRRWQLFTGREARLEATGDTFAEVAAGRPVVGAGGGREKGAGDDPPAPEGRTSRAR